MPKPTATLFSSPAADLSRAISPVPSPNLQPPLSRSLVPSARQPVLECRKNALVQLQCLSTNYSRVHFAAGIWLPYFLPAQNPVCPSRCPKVTTVFLLKKGKNHLLSSILFNSLHLKRLLCQKNGHLGVLVLGGSQYICAFPLITWCRLPHLFLLYSLHPSFPSAFLKLRGGGDGHEWCLCSHSLLTL